MEIKRERSRTCCEWEGDGCVVVSRIDHLEHPSAGISLLKKGPKGQGINNRENPPADGCSRWMDQYMTFTRTVCRLALASPSLIPSLL